MGYTSNELLTNTNSFTGEKLEISDEQLSDLQYENRLKSHTPSSSFKSTQRGRNIPHPVISKGDIVMVKSDRNKTEGRKLYLVVDMIPEKRAAVVQKFVKDQLRNKKNKSED